MPRILTRLDDSRMSPRVEKILKMLNDNVVGQEHAIRQIPDALEMALSGYKEERRPIGSFFFLGPSGTGKTETAEQLARCLFGSPDALTKVEGETMAQEHQTAALIGSPPGYVGFQDPDDPMGEHPKFTNWNLYKHHFEYLQRENRGLVDEMDELEKQMKGLAEKRVELARRYREIIKFHEDYDNQKRIMREEFKRFAEDPSLKNHPKEVVKFQELIQLANQLAKKAKLFSEEGPIVRKELIALSGPVKTLKEKHDALTAEYKAKGLDWEPGEPPPKNLMGIVLFDEMEKAHQNFHHLLYQILDKGKITISNGTVANFENCIIIATGNIASVEIADALNSVAMGFRKNIAKTKEEMGADVYDLALDRAKEDLPPPLLARFDSIEVFRPLDVGDMGRIFDLQVDMLKIDLKKKAIEVSLEIVPGVKDHLVERSMKHMEWGARLLKQRVRKYIRLKLIRLLVTRQISNGDSVVVDLEGEGENKKLFFSKAETQTGA